MSCSWKSVSNGVLVLAACCAVLFSGCASAAGQAPEANGVQRAEKEPSAAHATTPSNDADRSEGVPENPADSTVFVITPRGHAFSTVYVEWLTTFAPEIHFSRTDGYSDRASSYYLVANYALLSDAQKSEIPRPDATAPAVQARTVGDSHIVYVEYANPLAPTQEDYESTVALVRNVMSTSPLVGVERRNASGPKPDPLPFDGAFEIRSIANVPDDLAVDLEWSAAVSAEGYLIQYASSVDALEQMGESRAQARSDQASARVFLARPGTYYFRVQPYLRGTDAAAAWTPPVEVTASGTPAPARTVNFPDNRNSLPKRSVPAPTVVLEHLATGASWEIGFDMSIPELAALLGVTDRDVMRAEIGQGITYTVPLPGGGVLLLHRLMDHYCFFDISVADRGYLLASVAVGMTNSEVRAIHAEPESTYMGANADIYEYRDNQRLVNVMLNKGSPVVERVMVRSATELY